MAIELQTTSLETIKLSELPEAIALNESDYSLIVQNGTSKKIKGLLLKGNAGDNGKSIEIQRTDTHIQWRQEEGQWIDLVALVDLKGDKGEQGEGANVDLTDYATKVWVTQQLASYYTKTEIDLSLSNKADVSHTHAEYASIDHVHNYNDLTNKPTIPSKTSDLTNDSGFLTSMPSEYVTEEEMNTALSTKANKSDIPSLEGYATETFVTNKIAEAALSGGEVDLSGYATKDELNAKADVTHTHTVSDITNLSIPSKTSQLTNDSGYITIDDVHTHSNKTVLDGITAQKVTSWDNKSNFSGSYNDLTNKPTIPAEYTHPSTHPASMITGLSTVATSGSYDDLLNKPTIPTAVSQLTNDSGFLTVIPDTYATKTYVDDAIANASTGGEVDLNEYAKKSELSTVATSGSYNDLSNKPTIPTKVSQLTNDSGYITSSDVHTHSNKTVLDGITSEKVTSWNNKSDFSGDYNDLTNKPTIPAEYTHPSTHPSSMITGLSKVATSGSYADLTNKPTIPTVTNDLTNGLKSNYDTAYTHSQSAHAPSNAQKNSDITKAEIEAKLTGDITTHTHSQYLTEHQPLTGYAKTADLATVATTGSYNDLSNKPTIPSNTSQLTNDSDFTTKTYVDSKVDSKTVTTLTSATTVTLTTARQQYLKATRNITLKLPTISTTTDITEIHFYYTAASVYTITFSDSNIKWQSATPTIEANKYYEFIFTRLHDGTWLAGVIVYA